MTPMRFVKQRSVGKSVAGLEKKAIDLATVS